MTKIDSALFSFDYFANCKIMKFLTTFCGLIKFEMAAENNSLIRKRKELKNGHLNFA